MAFRPTWRRSKNTRSEYPLSNSTTARTRCRRNGRHRGGADQSLDEQGKVNLVNGQFEVTVVFETPKYSADYEFNCYVENTIDSITTVVQWQPQARSKYQFTIALAPAVDSDNYVFYWHVRVRDAAVAVQPIIDAPEAARTTLLPGAEAQTIQLTNPRSNTDYSFSEFRVENLVDGDNQRPIWVQLVGKTTISFDIAISPPVDTANYFLAWRTP